MVEDATDRDGGAGALGPAPRMPASRQRMLLEAWAFLCLLLAVRAFAGGMLSRGAPGPVAIAVTIDLNRAGIGELAALPGIGLQRARAIVLHRVRFGPFRTVADLVGVDGIGEGTVAALAPFARVGPP